MAIFNLSAFQNGIQRPIDGANEGLISGLRIGTSGDNALLTKAIVADLVSGGDASAHHNHDSIYFTESELSSAVDGSSGASLVKGANKAYTNISGLTTFDLQDFIDQIDSALSSAGSNEFEADVFRVIDQVDGSKKLAFNVASVSAATVRTVTMPDADVNLGLVNDSIQSSEKGAANGVATLDANSKIPSAQLPAIAITDVFAVADIAARDALVIGIADGEVQEGDVAIAADASADVVITAGAASYIYSGSAWLLLKAGDEVLSINGQTGVVSLSTSDISEGSNLYWTQGRFDSALAAKSSSDVSEGSNLYWTQTRFDTAFSAKDSDDLSEGVTNVFYTEARFDSSLSGKSTTDVSEGSNLYYTQGRFDSALTAKDTGDLSEGSNLYYTQGRFDSALTAKSSSDLSEGSNLYFTEARAKDACLFIDLTNNTGVQLDAGTIVALSKSTAGEVIVADASTIATCEAVAGVVGETIANGASGKVQVAGLVTVINKDAAYSPGLRVYVSETGGNSTTTAPSASGSVIHLLGVSSGPSALILQPNLIAIN